MYPVLNIFGCEIRSYTALCFVGLAVCVVFAVYAAGKRNILRTYLLPVMLITLCGVIVGGHLLFFCVKLLNIITEASVYRNIGFRGALYTSLVSCGGQVFYGGLAGALAVFLLGIKLSKPEDPGSMLDTYTCCIPLFHLFGRLGCFLGGCCYGIECSIGILVTSNDNVPSVNGVTRFPVQLLEALLNAAIFAILFTFFKKRRYEGKLIYMYLASYAFIRFFTEFLRGDSARGVYFHLSTSQWISLGIIVFVTLKIRNMTKNTAAGKG